MPPKIIFGAGGIGRGNWTNSWDTPEKVSTLLSKLRELGVDELDSAANYPPGNAWHADTLLGEAKAAGKGFIIDGKARYHIEEGEREKNLTAENIHESLSKTLQLTGASKLGVYYAHGPNDLIPHSVTASAFNAEYLADRFSQLGLSNYSVSQMRDYLSVCEEKGYVKPSVYEGNYSAVVREGEEELYPLLREHGISVFAYSPLAGGFLTGKLSKAGGIAGEGLSELNRFTGPNKHLRAVKGLDRPEVHEAMRRLMEVGGKSSEGISAAEASLRWLAWHSVLGEGDGIIVGATKMEQVVRSVGWVRKGPLPEEVRRAVEAVWEAKVRGREGEVRCKV